MNEFIIQLVAIFITFSAIFFWMYRLYKMDKDFEKKYL